MFASWHGSFISPFRVPADARPLRHKDGHSGTEHGSVEMTTLKEIIERCSVLSIEERRHQEESYCEIVFYNREIDAWHSVLSEALGPPVKPAGNKPAEDMARLTQAYGGIRTGQTLFVREFEGVTVMAMFWPWEDGKHTTLKMAVLEKDKEEVAPSSSKTRWRFAGLRTAPGQAFFHKPSQKPV